MKLLASLSFFPVVHFCFFWGITDVQKRVIFHEDGRSSQLQTWPRTALGNDTGLVYILNYSFVSRWLCALASLGVGSGLLALAFSLLSMVGQGPAVGACFPGSLGYSTGGKYLNLLKHTLLYSICLVLSGAAS